MDINSTPTERLLMEAVTLLLDRHKVEGYNEWPSTKNQKREHLLEELTKRLAAPPVTVCARCGHRYSMHEGDGAACLHFAAPERTAFVHVGRCQCSGFVYDIAKEVEPHG